MTNTGDAGSGSLRQAILDANGSSGPDTIGFNIPTSDPGFVDGAFVITPLSALPALSDDTGGTTIDGSTQTAIGDTNPFAPEIVLDGSAIAFDSGLHLASDNNQVHGLNIQRFLRPYDQGGVLITGDANIITGNFIGTNAAGTEAAGNHNGIFIQDGSRNLIGGTAEGAGNVISGNARGIYITGHTSTENVIQGNTIGTDPTGSTVVTDGYDTGTNNDGIIIVAGSNNLIGGTAPGAGNLISGFWTQGIWIRGSATGNLMEGNLIGTNAEGNEMLDFPGRGHSSLRGIWIEDATNNVVGAGNVVSGNFLGVVIEGAEATGNVVRGSLVGTDPTGTIAVGNVRDGIRIHQGASKNLIGGTSAADRNTSRAMAGMASTSSKGRTTRCKAITSGRPRMGSRRWVTSRKESTSTGRPTTSSVAELPAPATSSPETWAMEW